MAEQISDARQLLDAAEVREIRFHEFSAKRVAEQKGQSDSVNMQVLVRVDELEIGVRCRADVGGAGAAYVADAEAVFELSEQFEVPGDVLQEFVERVGLPVVYPYIREAITGSAGKLSLPRPVLKILRAEDVKLTQDAR